MKIQEKADYVRRKLKVKKHREHHCHWPGCDTPCAPAAWGCRKHWFMLPLRLRSKIWAAYRPGQEDTQSPSRKYIEVALEVRRWIRRTQEQFPDPPLPTRRKGVRA